MMLVPKLRRQKHLDAQRITGLIRYTYQAFAIRDPSTGTVKLVPPAGLNLQTQPSHPLQRFCVLPVGHVANGADAPVRAALASLAIPLHSLGSTS